MINEQLSAGIMDIFAESRIARAFNVGFGMIIIRIMIIEMGRSNVINGLVNNN